MNHAACTTEAIVLLKLKNTYLACLLPRLKKHLFLITNGVISKNKNKLSLNQRGNTNKNGLRIWTFNRHHCLSEMSQNIVATNYTKIFKRYKKITRPAHWLNTLKSSEGESNCKLANR